MKTQNIKLLHSVGSNLSYPEEFSLLIEDTTKPKLGTSIKQVLLVLFRNYCSRFHRTTVTQLSLVVSSATQGICDRSQLEKAVSLLGEESRRVAGRRHTAGQEQPRVRLCRGRRGREAGPGGARCRVLCRVLSVPGARERPRGMHRAADGRQGERLLPRQPRTMAAPGRCRGCRAGSGGGAALCPAVLRRAGALGSLCRQAERGGALPAPRGAVPLRGSALPLRSAAGHRGTGSALRVQGALPPFGATVAPVSEAGLQRFLPCPASLDWSAGQLLAEPFCVLNALRLGRSGTSEGGCSVG